MTVLCQETRVAVSVGGYSSSSDAPSDSGLSGGTRVVVTIGAFSDSSAVLSIASVYLATVHKILEYMFVYNS